MATLKENIVSLDREGRLHGDQISFFPSGYIDKIKPYHHGRLQGVVTGYHDFEPNNPFHASFKGLDRSLIKYICHYDDDHKHGQELMFNTKGKIVYLKTFVDNYENGLYMRYNEIDGSIEMIKFL